MLIQYTCSYLTYWRPFLQPQIEDAPCCGDRDTHTHTHTYIYIIFFLNCVFTFPQDFLLLLLSVPDLCTYLYCFWFSSFSYFTFIDSYTLLRLSPFFLHLFSHNPPILLFNYVSSFLYLVSLYISFYVPSIVSFSLNLLVCDLHLVLT